MSKVFAVAAGLLGGAAAAAATFAIMQPARTGGDSSAIVAENTALRSRIDELEKKITAIDARVQNNAVAAAPMNRESAPIAKAENNAAAGTPSQPAVNVSSQERDTIFALIKEERELRDKERLDKQKQQIREGIATRIGSLADRIGLDASGKEALTKLYLDNLSREEEIRKAYPIKDYNSNDPNIEKRKLELEAVRKDLDARVATIVPTDKKEEWDQRARFISRMGDFAEAAQSMQDGNFPMMRGGMDFGGGPGGGFGNFGPPGGGRNNGGGGGDTAGGGNNNGGGRRGNRGGGRNGGGSAAGATDAPAGPGAK